MTTCLTDGALFLIDLRMPVVPMTAGSIRSCVGQLQCSHPSCLLQTDLLNVGDIEVEWTGGMKNSLKWRV